MIQQKSITNTFLLSAAFFSVLFFVPFFAGAASDFAVPDWSVSYRLGDRDVILDDVVAAPLGDIQESVYGWPSSEVGLGTVYGDIYKGEINSAVFVSGHELVGSGAATATDTILET
ncbi:MAG: hypothetical protein G01um101448_464, partial [Parcubacteria group bacterium Gr01-1014_48]